MSKPLPPLPRAPTSEAETLLEQPLAARSTSARSGLSQDTDQPRGAQPPVQHVGRFLLLKVLGQGGMGVVYSAYDPDLDRKVALKLLLVKGGSPDQEEGRARLMREAQAMARVSHPHVIPVFEVGSWQGQVYLAMELVEGGTLREWSRESKRSWRETLEKYLAAGEGLAAAHAAGLVHRDFKPANVLVGRNGRVFVTDFGLARPDALFSPQPVLPEDLSGSGPSALVQDDPLTRSGVVMGTPNYMSPEQYRGDALDGRSDQFSFCAALYLALYQTRPFDPEEMSRAAARRGSASFTPSQTPTRLASGGPAGALPSVIQEPPKKTKVPAWVRRVVMRGLSLEPGERFASMQVLLRALSPEPRRVRRQWLGLGALAGVTLVAAGAVAVERSRLCTGAEGQMAEVWGPAEHERMAAAFQKVGGASVAEMLRRASGGLDTYAQAWSQRSVEVCEATRRRGERTELLLSQQVVCLERRRESLRALVKQLEEVDAKSALKALDAVYALPSPEDCANLEALSELQPRPADPTRRAELDRLEAQVSDVKALLDLGRYPAALRKTELLGPAVEATGYLPLVAELRFHRGWLLSLMAKREEGARLLEQAVYAAESGRADRLEVSILNKLLFAAMQLDQFAEAERWGRWGEATVRRVGGDAVLESDLLGNRANLALKQDKPEVARPLLERALGLLDGLPPGHPKRARVTYALGRTLRDLGDIPAAVKTLTEALRRLEVALGPQHQEVALAHKTLSDALLHDKQPEQALEHALASVTIFRSNGAAPLTVGEALDYQGQCLLGLKRYEEALRIFREALALKANQVDPDDFTLQASQDGVGKALLGLGRAPEAIVILRRASSDDAFKDVPERDMGDTTFALAQALWQAGRDQEARVEADRALARLTHAGDTQRADEVKSWMAVLGP